MSSHEARKKAVKGPWQPRTYRISVTCIDPGFEKQLLSQTKRCFSEDVAEVFRDMGIELFEVGEGISNVWNWELRYLAERAACNE